MAGATAFIPAALTIAGSLMGKSGADTSAEGAVKAGEGARIAAARTAVAKQFEAEQLRINAGTEIAAALRAGFEEERQARLVQSRQIALAAASGAGASDPTVVQMISRTAKEGSYRAAVALYGGAEKARALRMAASGKDYEGAVALEAGELQAEAYNLKAQGYKTAGLGELLKGGSSLFAKYGFGGPKGSGDAAVTGSGGVNMDTSWLDTGTESFGTIG